MSNPASRPKVLGLDHSERERLEMEARFEPPRNANIVKAVVLMKKVVEEEGRHKYMIFAGRRIDFHPGDNPRKIIHNFLHPPLPVD